MQFLQVQSLQTSDIREILQHLDNPNRLVQQSIIIIKFTCLMKKGQQQTLVNSIYEYIPSLTQSVLDRKGQITSSFSSAFTNTLSKIGEIKTNLIYSIKHSDIHIIPLVQRKEIEIRKDGSFAQLLGHSYDAENSYKFLFVYRNIFWYTYRQGIKEIDSDNGWGCMIRTMQMVFAETLKRNLRLKDTEHDQYQVIRHFSEMSEGVLSLSEICKEGNINKRWTSSLEILGIFKRIMAKYPQHFKFNIEIFSSGVVYKSLQSQLFDHYPAMISLTNRVGLNNIPSDLQPHYFEMMNHPSWVGTIGGVKGQALYIIGSYDSKVIFLDPHYVQSNDEEMEVETYFNKTPRGIEISELSPSLSFCYYLQDRESHVKWLEWTTSTSSKYYPNLVFEFISEQAKQKLQSQKEESPQAKMEPIPESPLDKSNSNSITIIVEEDGSNYEIQTTRKSEKIELLQMPGEKCLKGSEEMRSFEMNNDSDEFELLS